MGNAKPKRKKQSQNITNILRSKQPAPAPKQVSAPAPSRGRVPTTDEMDIKAHISTYVGNDLLPPFEVVVHGSNVSVMYQDLALGVGSDEADALSNLRYDLVTQRDKLNKVIDRLP